MSNSPRRSGFVRDHRVVLVAAGALTVVAAITFFPQASNAAQAVPTVNCPDVSARLAGIAIPASAQAEVSRNLALLNTQIDDANRRIASSVGQGGPNFIQNVVLGPLAGKRTATLDRIRIAIGRQGAALQGLDALAACTLNDADGQAGATRRNGSLAAQGTGGFRQRNNSRNDNQNDDQRGQNDPQDQLQPAPGTDPAAPTPPTPTNPTFNQAPVGQQAADGRQATGSQNILGNSCANSRLQPHDGFQNGNRCVSTQFGEVGDQSNNPTLLITSAPRMVRANQGFDLRVSTRNLVRDRFLAAAQGGYYKESSFLAADGTTRGHFHTACRMLDDRFNAPDPAPAPAFFAATEDGRGGRNPDSVTVRISGLPRGEAQCAVWAGDGSHRVPMMQRANQIPAFDVVRISVR